MLYPIFLEREVVEENGNPDLRNYDFESNWVFSSNNVYKIADADYITFSDGEIVSCDMFIYRVLSRTDEVNGSNLEVVVRLYTTFAVSVRFDNLTFGYIWARNDFSVRSSNSCTEAMFSGSYLELIYYGGPKWETQTYIDLVLEIQISNSIYYY